MWQRHHGLAMQGRGRARGLPAAGAAATTLPARARVLLWGVGGVVRARVCARACARTCACPHPTRTLHVSPHLGENHAHLLLALLAAARRLRLRLRLLPPLLLGRRLAAGRRRRRKHPPAALQQLVDDARRLGPASRSYYYIIYIICIIISPGPGAASCTWVLPPVRERERERFHCYLVRSACGSIDSEL